MKSNYKKKVALLKKKEEKEGDIAENAENLFI